MKETLICVLMTKEGYSKHSAVITANDLCSINNNEIRAALMKWLSTGEYTNVAEGEINCKNLMVTFRMKYPAALIFVDWYRSNPNEAMRCLTNQGG